MPDASRNCSRVSSTAYMSLFGFSALRENWPAEKERKNARVRGERGQGAQTIQKRPHDTGLKVAAALPQHERPAVADIADVKLHGAVGVAAIGRNA